MSTYLDCWVNVATALLSQALAGEPELADGLPRPLSAGSFGFSATLSGDDAGRFSVLLDGSILDASLVGEDLDQKEGWREILREVAGAAAGDLLSKTGRNCRVDSFDPIESEAKVSRAFQLVSGDRSWTILVRDEVRIAEAEAAAAEPRPAQAAKSDAPTQAQSPAPQSNSNPRQTETILSERVAVAPGIELLLDVELDASLRFGCREMPLGEVLDLGPGDVVQLDRNVTDPVDLIVGDKIVARGEVVLVNGNFGLRVTEVASPKRRLESIRCLF